MNQMVTTTWMTRTQASVRFQGRVGWARNDQVNLTTRYIRMYLGEQREAESLGE
jgi:hypothetical protein